MFDGNIENLWITFKKVLNDCINKNVPLKPKRDKKSKKLWITRGWMNELGF